MEGKGKFMLPMKDKLSASDAELVLTYIRNFKEGKQVVKIEPKEAILPPAPSKSVSTPVPSPTTSAARPLQAVDDSAAREETAARIRVASVNFRQYCLNCHGVDGRGTEMKTAMPTIPDFKLNTWQDSHTNPQLVASILDGKGTLMPAFRGRMDETQTKDIVAYIRAFNPSATPPTPAPTSGFEGRFQQLQQEWETLQKQLKEITPNKDKK
jgi:mono/diheme cytochrome c family protein